MRYFQQLVCLLLAALICACGSSAPMIHDRIDPMTGATITHPEVPLVFYRERSARAAYAREFINLGPLQINRMGQYRYFLWLAAWSTIQNADQARGHDGLETIIVFADGAPLQLAEANWTTDAVGSSESVYVKQEASAVVAYYEVTIAQLRLLASATDIRLQTSGPQVRVYEPWDRQAAARASLQAFVEYVSY